MALVIRMNHYSDHRCYRGGFRSYGEEQIARCLGRHGIEYYYEYPLAIVEGGKVRIYYPDFTLPEYGLIVEYFGVSGDPDYDRRTRHKLEAYRSAGIDGVFLFPDAFEGDWPSRILNKIEGTLVERLERLQHRESRRTGSYARR